MHLAILIFIMIGFIIWDRPQGKRMKFRVQLQGNLQGIISKLASALSPQSIMTANLVTIGESWLDLAIYEELIEPIKNPE